MIRRLATLVEPDGLFLGAFLGGCRAYRVGPDWAPSPGLTHADLTDALAGAGLPPDELTRIDTPELSTNGFDHLYVAACTRTDRRLIVQPAQRRSPTHPSEPPTSGALENHDVSTA